MAQEVLFNMADITQIDQDDKWKKEEDLRQQRLKADIALDSRFPDADRDRLSAGINGINSYYAGFEDLKGDIDPVDATRKQIIMGANGILDLPHLSPDVAMQMAIAHIESAIVSQTKEPIVSLEKV